MDQAYFHFCRLFLLSLDLLLNRNDSRSASRSVRIGMGLFASYNDIAARQLEMNAFMRKR